MVKLCRKSTGPGLIGFFFYRHGFCTPCQTNSSNALKANCQCTVFILGLYIYPPFWVQSRDKAWIGHYMYLFILGKGGATNPKVMVTFCTRHFLSSRGYNWENGVQNKKQTIHYSETLQNQLHLTQTVVVRGWYRNNSWKELVKFGNFFVNFKEAEQDLSNYAASRLWTFKCLQN